MRSSSSRVCLTTSPIFASVSKSLNSRISAPAMKLESLPLMSTRPFASPRIAASSTALTISPSSSVGRRPSEFMLSPLRSKIAQAMPSKSIEKRQSCKSGSVVEVMGKGLLGGQMFGSRGAAFLRRRLPNAGKLLGGEVVDGDHPRHEVAQLGQGERLGFAQNALGLGLGDPVAAVEAFHVALANSALQFPIGFLAGHDALKRIIEQSGTVGGIVGDENVPGETVAEGAGFERRANDLPALPVGRWAAPRPERKYERRHQPRGPAPREIADDA